MISSVLDRAKRSQGTPWITALGSLFFCGLLFTVPYHVPMRPTVSESYAFGYSNRAGEVLIALWLVLLALFGPHLRRMDADGKPLTGSTLTKALAISAAIALVLYLCTRQLNGYGESVYFNDRLRLVLEGHLPYRDFEYAYGAGLLYVPALLVWLLHLPPGDAYGMVWIAASLAGVWLLYLTLRAVAEQPGAQRPIFLLFWAYSLSALCCLGLNYTLFRFVLPCWLATVLHKRLFATQDAGSATAALLILVPSYLLLLLVSPELAIAFAFGMLIYVARYGRLTRRPNALAFGSAVAAVAVISWLALRLGVFNTVRAFAAGGYNFPLMPGPHVLLLLLLMAVCALYAGQELRRSRPGVLLALIAGSALGLAGALGRADEVHALMNPLGLVLAGFFLLSGYVWLRRAVLAVAWLLMFVLLLPVIFRDTPLGIAKAALPAIFAHEYRHNGSEQMTALDQRILARMTQSLGAADAEQKFAERRAYARSLVSDGRSGMDVPAIFGQPPGTIFYAPFGFLPDRSGIYHSRYVQEGYFLGLVNVTTPAEVARKTSELTERPERPLLLPPDFEQACGRAGPGSTALLRALFRYPYRRPIVHPISVLEPFCEALHTNFHQVGSSISEHFGYLLWMPDRH